METRLERRRREETLPPTDEGSNPINELPTKNYPVIIPYIKGVSEEIRRVYKSNGVRAYLKLTNRLRQRLVRPKDKLEKDRITGPVYHIF